MNITITLIFAIIISISICATNNNGASTEQTIPYVNKRIQNCINTLFSYLKIEKHFKHYYKVKILLTMYDNLNNAIEYNWKVYSDIRKSVAVANNISDNLLYNLVEDALITGNTTTEKSKTTTEIYRPREENKEGKSYENNVNITNTSKTAVTVATDAWDNDILNRFLDKINNLTVDDLIGEPANKTYREINKEKRNKLLTRRNLDLKTWDPNEYISNRRMSQMELVEKFPFIASVHVVDKFTCTGAIISKDAVITAASCLPLSADRNLIQRLPNLITVRVGSDFANDHGEKVPAMDVEFHPEFESKTLKNNVALVRLKLQKHARNRPKIRKIKLDDKEPVQRSTMSKIQIFGYGPGDGSVKGDKKLAVASLGVVPLQNCTALYSRKFVTEANFCAGLMTRRATLCNGDMGSPAISEDLLVGIVAFGDPECGRQESPTVFVKISFHYTWINGIIKQKWKTKSLQYATPRLDHVSKSDKLKRPKIDKLKKTPPKQSIYNIETINIFKSVNDVPKKLAPTVIKQDKFNSMINKYAAFNIYNPARIGNKRSKTPFDRPDVGLPKNLPYEFIQDELRSSIEIDNFIKKLLEKKTITVKGTDIRTKKLKPKDLLPEGWGDEKHYLRKDKTEDLEGNRNSKLLKVITKKKRWKDIKRSRYRKEDDDDSFGNDD